MGFHLALRREIIHLSSSLHPRDNTTNYAPATIAVAVVAAAAVEMAASYTPMIDIDGRQMFPEPYSSPWLEASLRWSMIPIAALATVSVGMAAYFVGYIAYSILSWRLSHKTFSGYSQFIFLVLNLLLFDLQQSAAFLVNWHWFSKNHILAPTPACFAQGWLLNSGDLGNAFFSLAITIHTYFTVVCGRQISWKWFLAGIAGTWFTIYFLTSFGVALYGDRYFVRAGSWCWISSAHEGARLWGHYLWIFIAQFGIIIMSILTAVSLYQKIQSLLVDGRIPPNSPNAATIRRLKYSVMLMMIIPVVYILLTLPLSVGRMWAMTHGSQSTGIIFSAAAGSLLTSCGWVDSILYLLTRKRLLQEITADSAMRRANNQNPVYESHELERRNVPHTATVDRDDNIVQDRDVEGNTAQRTKRRRSVLSIGQMLRSGPFSTESVNRILPDERTPRNSAAADVENSSARISGSTVRNPTPRTSEDSQMRDMMNERAVSKKDLTK